MIWKYQILLIGKSDVTNNVIAQEKALQENLVIGNDSKTIKVNDPKIDIQKSVDKLEYKVR